VAAEDFLTEADKLLLLRDFNSPDPESIEGLLEKLPADAKVADILFRYDVTPDGGMLNRHVRPFIYCAHCEGARHWRGFVIELEGGAVALVGEDCGGKQFGAKFRLVESDFYADKGRQDDLHRLIAIRALIPAFEEEMEMLRRSAVMGAFDAYMRGLRSFGRLRQAMEENARSNDSVLTCLAYDRDHAAEAAYAETLPEAKHHREKIEGAQTDYIRRTRMEEYRRWIDTLPHVEREKVETFGRFSGGAIFGLAPGDNLVESMRKARQLGGVRADEFMCNRSDYWDSRNITQGIAKLREAVRTVRRSLAMLNALDHFTAADNLATIAKWSQREVELPQPRIDYSVKAVGRTLIDEEDRHRLALPHTWAVPALPHTAALLAALGD